MFYYSQCSFIPGYDSPVYDLVLPGGLTLFEASFQMYDTFLAFEFIAQIVFS